MLDEILTGASLVKLITSVIALVGFIGGGILFRIFAGMFLKRMESKEAFPIAGIVLKSVKTPLRFCLFPLGYYCHI